jgi:putative transcriptional regulator
MHRTSREEGYILSIKYDKLFALIRERRKTEYFLRQNGISPSILDKLKHGKGGLDARTIQKLCKLLTCQPGDIMEYIPDEQDNAKGDD